MTPQTPQGAALSDADIENCIDNANRKFNSRRQGPSGQQMTTYDDWKYWLAREVEHTVRAADRRLTAEQLCTSDPEGHQQAQTDHAAEQGGAERSVTGHSDDGDAEFDALEFRTFQTAALSTQPPGAAEQGGVERCPSGKCADPASDCFGSGCVVSGSPAASDVETIIALKSSEQASLSPGAYQVLTNAVANTRLTTAPVCPHCGHVEHDAWEWTFGPGLEGERIGDCNSCGKEFRTYREVSVYYTTSRPAP